LTHRWQERRSTNKDANPKERRRCETSISRSVESSDFSITFPHDPQLMLTLRGTNARLDKEHGQLWATTSVPRGAELMQ
jgi:hypothetical protein